MITTRISRLHSLLFISFCWMVLQLFTPVVDAFPSWLKCIVELDPEEIIMSQSVIPFVSATHKVLLEVGWKDPGTQKFMWHSSPEVASLQLPPMPVDDEDENNMDTIVEPFPLMVRLQVPEELLGQDVHFVVEVQTAIEDQAAEAIEFVGPTMTCDGRRASSRSATQAVTLAWDYDLHPTLQPFQLLGAWATGMEAVSLTAPLMINPTTTATTTTTTTTATTTTNNPPTIQTKESNTQNESNDIQEGSGDNRNTKDEL